MHILLGAPDAQGDARKLTFVSGLGPAARKFPRNLQRTLRVAPGAQEACRVMRFGTQAMRDGAPLFVPFFPRSTPVAVRAYGSSCVIPSHMDHDASNGDWRSA